MSGDGTGLRLRYLGGCEALRGGAVIHLESVKTAALLAYCVVAPGPHPRGRLMALLWPELPEGRASAALRRALWDLRRKLSPSGEPLPLSVTRGAVAIDRPHAFDCDVARFVAGTRRRGTGPPPDRDEAERLDAAVSLYRGDLLEGLYVEAAPAFEEWLLAERERLRLLALQALRPLVELYRQQGEPLRALAQARRLLALDPWLEAAHRAVAELLAMTGHRGQAIRQLEACRRILADELGTSPSAETLDLETRLKGGAGAGSAPVAERAFRPPPRAGLPLAATPFIGRQKELETVASQLADPSCRLLALLGPGGIGKTRLAIQAVSTLVASGPAPASFPDGFVFVAPDESAGEHVLAEAIVRALDLEPAGTDDVEARLVAALSGLRLLLVLDGFERRLAEAPLVSRLLAGTPELKVLVTSRERLGLEEEWVLEVAGLETPHGPVVDPARFPAVQLFLAGARRARLGFDPGADALASIVSICSALDGMPLAIEMAASWVRALPPSEVSTRIGKGLDFLRSPRRDAPSRQRSLRAVFDHAYGRLGPEERRVLRALSVFVGGMTWDAARAVGRAEPESLRNLADQSFLHLEASSGRYGVHEVLRAFAGEELTSNGERDEVSERHARFFAGLLDAEDEAVTVRSERTALERVASDLENLRAAWRFSLERSDGAYLSKALGPLSACFSAWGTFAEGERLASEAVELLVGRGGGAPDEAAARALTARGAFRNRLGRAEEAEADLRHALALQPDGSAGERAEAFLQLGHVCARTGRFLEARAHLGESISLARRGIRSRILCDALARLGRGVLDEGRHEEARTLFSESLEVASGLRNEPAMLQALNQLGWVDYFAGDLDAAGRRLEEALALARAEGSRPVVASALEGLGFVAQDLGDLERAATCYRESLAVYQEQGDRFGISRACILLGEVDRSRGDFAEARRWSARALATSRAIGSVYLCGIIEGNLAYMAAAEGKAEEVRAHAEAALDAHRKTGSHTVGLPVLVALAEVLHGLGLTARAVSLLRYVLGHPGNRQDHRTEVERVMARVRRESPGLELVPPPPTVPRPLGEVAADALALLGGGGTASTGPLAAPRRGAGAPREAVRRAASGAAARRSPGRRR